MPAYDIGPRIGIGGEKEFKNSIKAIDSEIRALQNQLRTLSKEYDENDRSVEGVTKKQNALNQAIETSRKRIDLLTNQYEKQLQELKRLEDALEQARKENGEGSNEALKAEAAYAGQAKVVNDLGARLERAKEQLITFENQLQELGNTATRVGDQLQSAGDKLEAVGGKLSSAGNTLTAAVTAPLLAAGGAAIVMASDYEESLNKVDVAFGDSAERVKEFAQTTVDSYGIAEGTALDMAALFGDMATSMKIPREEAAEMSERLVGLAGDLASFKNISLDQVGTALKSIFTGETESLKELGVVMTEANLDAFALAEGFGKTTDEMTEAEKVQLRYQYVLSATQNAQGDYARTADGTANSLRTLQESAKELGVAFGQELLPQITPLIQKGTKLVKSFGEMGDEEKKLIVSTAAVAAAAGPAVKVLGTATTGLGKLAKGAGTVVGDLGKLVQSGGKATDSMSLFGKVLGTLGPKGSLMGAAVVGVAALGTTIMLVRDNMVKADIEGRFGDIALSAEEVEEAAEKLTTTDWTIQVDTYIDAKEKVDEAFETLEEAQQNLEKETWKISFGLELSQEDIDSYTAAIDSYIQSAISAVEEASYTAQVAINTVFYPGSEAATSVLEYSQAFYAETQGQLDQLGQDLAKVVDEALADGILTNEELLDINGIQSRMQELLDKIADRQYKIELKKLELSTDGSDLTAESFQGVMEEAGQILQDRISGLEGVTAEVTVDLEEMLETGEIGQETYEKWTQQMELYLAGQTADFTIPVVEFGVQTIEDTYGDVITQTKDDFQNRLDEAFERIELNPDQTDWFNKLWEEFDLNFEIADGKARAGVEELVQVMQPSKESLEMLRQQYIDAGQVPPTAITEGLGDIYALEQMSGAADNTFELLALSIATSPARQEALAQSLLAGQEMDAQLATALRENYGLVWDASTGMWTELNTNNAEAAAEAADYLNQYGAEMGESLAQSIADQYGLVYENGKWMVSQAAQGVRDNTPTLLMEAEKSASDTVNQFDTTISGATVGPVKVATPDIASSVGVALDIAQSVANSRTIYYTVAARGAAGLAANSVSAYADGGLVDEPQLALIGEAGDEMVIPLERNRSRALDLWYQAGQELNAFAADSARAVGAIRREQIINNTTNRNMAINNAEGAIVIHTQATDGKQLYKELVREMQKDVKRKEAAYGRF